MVKFLGRLFKLFIIIVLILSLLIITFRFINFKRLSLKEDKAIDVEGYLDLNGAKQYIQVRGKDKDKDLVLFLHGGPASPHAYVSYYYQEELEGDFIFVNWDQRSSGRSYYANEKKDSVDLDILYRDLETLVDYLLERYNKDKIILVGHSWGTILGTKYAKDHGDKLIRYIGIGQVWQVKEGERLAVDEAIKLAKEKNNTEDIDFMNSAFNKVYDSLSKGKLKLNDIMDLRKVSLGKYLDKGVSMPLYKALWLGITSPHMNFYDFKWFFKNGDIKEYERLFTKIFVDVLDYNLIGESFSVPFIVIMGEDDWVTPALMSKNNFDSIKAPYKHLYLIKDAGHAPYFDKREDFIRVFRKANNLE